MPNFADPERNPQKDADKDIGDGPNKDQPASSKLSVTATALNVREKPTSSSKIVGSVTRGMQLEQVGEQGSWINAAYSGGKTGWVYSKYVKKEAAAGDKDRASDKPALEDKPEEVKSSEGREGLDMAAALRYNKARGLTKEQWRTIQKAAGVKVVDGILGPKTTQAIYDFQVDKGLAQADGKAGPATQKVAGVQPDPNGAAGSTEEKDAEKSDGTDEQEDIPSGNISANFSWQDFVSARDPQPVPKRYRPNVIALVAELEKLRKIIGKPLRITPNGGYRSAKSNANGGAKRSQHLVGKASDLQVPGMTPSKVRKAIRKAVKDGKMRAGGIGGYPSFSHYDIGNPRTWGQW